MMKILTNEEIVEIAALERKIAAIKSRIKRLKKILKENEK